jgi:transposase
VKSTTIAIDLAKSVFEVGISHHPGHVSETHRLSREQIGVFMANQPATIVVMEACSSAHYWGRTFQGYGHQVKLLPPLCVRPYCRDPRRTVRTSRACWNLSYAQNHAEAAMR